MVLAHASWKCMCSMWLFSEDQQFDFMDKPEHFPPGVWLCQAPGRGLLWRTRRNNCELSEWSPRALQSCRLGGGVQRATAGAPRPSPGQMGLLILSPCSCWVCGSWTPATGERLSMVGLGAPSRSSWPAMLSFMALYEQSCDGEIALSPFYR